jgi:uncharacterized membrane protein (DUF485 family)
MADESDGGVRKEGVERELALLASRRLKLALILTATMLVTYFGFIGLVAGAKDALGTLLTEGLSLGILLGALVIVVAWVVTGIYVHWANKHYDTALEQVRAHKKEQKTSE